MEWLHISFEFHTDPILSAPQFVWNGAEAPGPASQTAVPPAVPGAVGSPQEQTAGVPQEPGAACASFPRPQ